MAEVDSGESVIRALYAITSDYTLGFPAQVQRLLALGCEHLGMALGALARVVDGRSVVEHVYGPGAAEAILGAADTLEIPVEVDGERWGALIFAASTPGARDEAAALDALRLMARWLGVELQRRRDEATLLADARALRRMTRIDPLTQLLNRRGIEHALARLVERAAQDRAPISALLIDVDDFKAVNDTYTHAIGDRVLIAVAERIQRAVRETDRVARIGGDEFLAVLPESSATQALTIAERVREAVRGQPVDTPAGPVSVRVSLGVSRIDAGAGTVTQLLGALSERLKASKRKGKDRVST